MKFRALVLTGVVAAAMSVFAGLALADDAPAAAAGADVVAVEEEEEVELTYQQQATLLVDTIIEDYTVRMAALQAIIDMREDDIAGLKDQIKKLNDNTKLLVAVMKAAQNVDKNIRPVFTALPDGDQKDMGITYLDRLITAITKYNNAQ